MISQKFFTEKMNALSNVWPTFNKFRFPRIYAIVVDLPEQALNEICETMIDEHAHAPLPKHFQEAAYEWKKRNNYWGAEVVDLYPISCVDCYETGFLFCQIKESEPETMMFCHCAFGVDAEERRPKSILLRWKKGEFETVYGFIKRPFPVAWFKPSEGDSETAIKNPIGSSKVKDWRKKITDAEDYFNRKSREAQQ